MITFGPEPLATAWPELMVLHRAHWLETEAFRHGQPFDPRLERYEAYERAGWFTLYVARDGARMIGNLGIYILPSMHTQQLIATEDTLYLIPEYRTGWPVINFIRYVEGECRKRGAVQMSTTAKNDRVGKLMKHLGYVCTDMVYSKLLNQGADSATLPLAVNSESSDGATRIST